VQRGFDGPKDYFGHLVQKKGHSSLSSYQLAMMRRRRDIHLPEYPDYHNFLDAINRQKKELD
jgi:hypothetical protein